VWNANIFSWKRVHIRSLMNSGSPMPGCQMVVHCPRSSISNRKYVFFSLFCKCFFLIFLERFIQCFLFLICFLAAIWSFSRANQQTDSRTYQTAIWSYFDAYDRNLNIYFAYMGIFLLVNDWD